MEEIHNMFIIMKDNSVKLGDAYYNVWSKYTGFTSNLDQRLKSHYDGKVKSATHRRPLELIYFEGCLNKEDAIRREKYLKTKNGKMFLGNRLKSYLNGPPIKNLD